MAQSYEDRVRRVLQYIFDNPAGDLSLDALADVAAMSRFHWHRVYHAMTGETCAQAVRRIRAHRAACLLVQTGTAIDRIAADCGYDNSQSFARTFRSHYGMSPVAFRRAGHPGHLAHTRLTGEPDMFPFEIRDCPPLRIAALPHKGPYPEIGRAFQQVDAVVATHELWPHVRGMAGVYYDSPADVAPEDLRSHAGVIVADGVEAPSDLELLDLPGGRHAVLTVTGSYSGLQAAWDHLYCNALPQSGVVPADAPPFEVYLNSPQDTAPQELLTEIRVPLLAQKDG